MRGRNRVRRNRLVETAPASLIDPGSENVIAAKPRLRGRDGIRIEKGHGNLVAGNVVVHTRAGGHPPRNPAPVIGGANNIVRRNLVRGSRDDGFLVNKKDDHSLLKGNVARGAGDDGFDVQSRTAS